MRFLVVSLFVILVPFEGRCQTDGAEMVKVHFGQFKKAVLASEGENTFQYINRESEEYFDHLRQLVLTADSLTLRKLPLVERMHVLIARQSFTPEKLQSMQSGKDFIIHAVTKGLILKNNLVMVELESINVAEKEAFALVRGGNSHNLLKFMKEGDIWKLNVPSLFENSGSGLQLFLLSNDWTEDEFIRRSLLSISGREPRIEIWHASKDP